MKILIVCERLEGHGGWYTYTRLLRDGLLARGHQVVTCSREGMDGDYPLLPSPLDALRKPWVWMKSVTRVRKLAEEIAPDVIHVTVEPYALLAAMLPPRWRQKTIMTIHGSYGVRPLLQLRSRLLACRMYKRLAGFVAVSDYTQLAVSRMLERRCRGKTCRRFSDRVHVIHNAVELPRGTAKTLDHGRPVLGTERRILLVGGVKPRKGILEALDACAVFKRSRGTPFTFTIVGTCDDRDPYVQRVRDRIFALELQKEVHLAGPMSGTALDNLYREADLYLMPSSTGPTTFVGYGIAFIEAASYGVPSIGPDTSGAAEAIIEGRTGYRADANNPVMIAERMQWILGERMINPDQCRKWAEEHSVEKKVKEMEEVYGRLVPES